MPLRVEVHLPSQDQSIEQDIADALRRVGVSACPAREVWVISVIDLPGREEWLAMATSGTLRSEGKSGWTLLTQDGSAGEPVYTYVYALVEQDRSPAAVAEHVRRLLSASRKEPERTTDRSTTQRPRRRRSSSA